MIRGIGTRLLWGLLFVLVTACQGPADRPLTPGADSDVAKVDPENPYGREERQPTVPAVEALIPRATFAWIAKAVAPTVVHLKTVQEIRKGWTPFRRRAGEGGMEGFFKRLWGRSKDSVVKQQGVGSGFLIHRAGYILTNNHVVNHAVEIRAVLSDGRELPAHWVGSDPRTDLALLQIEGDGPFPAAVLGDSEKLESGEWAMAVGSPLGLAQTFTVGVISATGRSHLGIASRENFIQTDASINYGNSGGPLLNINAEVIGINTAIMPLGQGIGFAIPINMARRFVETVLKRQRIKTAWLGLQVEASSSEGNGRDGVAVQSVVRGSPASRAGLRSADLVVRVDGEEVTELDQLQRMIADGEIGAERTLTINRNGMVEEIRIRSEERPARVFP
ncbi:MAG: trypsin-like peptidase domain-containing protein [Nitrospirae bacterium]|nr:trypsin-like peptidase domain-containing protein [Nitrospirota bacterium]